MLGFLQRPWLHLFGLLQRLRFSPLCPCQGFGFRDFALRSWFWHAALFRCFVLRFERLRQESMKNKFPSFPKLRGRATCDRGSSFLSSVSSVFGFRLWLFTVGVSCVEACRLSGRAFSPCDKTRHFSTVRRCFIRRVCFGIKISFIQYECIM